MSKNLAENRQDIRKTGLSLELLERLRCLREQPPALPQASAQIERLQRQIHRDLFDPDLNVKTLRVRCGLKDNNTSTLFRRVAGRSIRDYIEEERLRAAALILEREALPAVEAGLFVGFSSPQTFYRAFKRRFGCTPVEYNTDPYRTRLHPVGA